MIKNEDLNEISQIVGLDDKANKMKKNGKMKSTILDRLSSNNDSLPYPQEFATERKVSMTVPLPVERTLEKILLKMDSLQRSMQTMQRDINVLKKNQKIQSQNLSLENSNIDSTPQPKVKILKSQTEEHHTDIKPILKFNKASFE